MANEYVDVSPDMQFYNLLESYPYNLTGALCEYIDNSLQAFQAAKKSSEINLPDILKIKISIQDSQVTIRDEGVGIFPHEIQRAMKPAFSPKSQSLSEFGIGMKAASVWLGRKWVLSSYPIKPDHEPFSLSFDLDNLLDEKSTKVILDKNITSKKHGVEIVISKLNKHISYGQALRTWGSLEEVYQLFTSRKGAILKLSMEHYDNTKDKKKTTFKHKDFSQLLVANKPLIFPFCEFKNTNLYVIGEAIEWKQELEFIFEDKLVHGFISLGKESSQTNNPGIRLFRYKRLIKGTEAEPYRPKSLVGSANKAAPSRFYAELHLDGQAISNSKGDFIFDEDLFLETLAEQTGVLSFISQAENYRQKKVEIKDYTTFPDVASFEASTGKKSKSKFERKPEPKPKAKAKPKERKDSKRPSAVVVLEKQSAPENFLLLDTFINEAVNLYSEGRNWPFILAYRVILEVSIIQKLKEKHVEHYENARGKSIVSLYRYLQSNSNIIPDYYESLKRVLKSNNQGNEPFVGLLNLSSHGNYVPTLGEVDDLLKNTQQLLEWAFDYEGE